MISACPTLVGQHERERLDEVVVDAAALLDRGAQGREVVVGEHHVGGLLGRRGAAAPHRDADVGLAQRRRVVDAVAGDGDDLAARLQRPHEPQLVLRRDARVDVGASELMLVEASSSGPVTAGPPGSRSRADRTRGARVVAGDHLTRTPAAWQAAIASCDARAAAGRPWPAGRAGAGRRRSSSRGRRRRGPANTSTRRPSAVWRSISAAASPGVTAAREHRLRRALDVAARRGAAWPSASVAGVERQRGEPRVRGARGRRRRGPAASSSAVSVGIAERASPGWRRCTARRPAAARGRRRTASRRPRRASGSASGFRSCRRRRRSWCRASRPPAGGG